MASSFIHLVIGFVVILVLFSLVATVFAVIGEAETDSFGSDTQLGNTTESISGWLEGGSSLFVGLGVMVIGVIILGITIGFVKALS